MSTIGRIQAPASVRPGEAFEVLVLDGSDVLIPDGGAVEIDINGQCGARQFVQFPAIGRHTLRATARDATDGRIIDSASLDVRVDGPSVLYPTEQGLAVPILHAAPDPETPYRFTFSVGKPLSEKHREFDRAGPMSADRRYAWRFSDDPEVEPVITDSPWVTHDFLWDLDHVPLWTTRTISCEISPEDITVRRTLSVTSGVALLKARGYVTPVVRNDVTVDVGESTFTCTAYVHNVGEDRVTLDGRSVTPIGIGPADELPADYVTLGVPIVLEPRTVGVVVVQLRGGVDVPWEATGVVLRLAGESGAGEPVRLSATFDLPLRPRALPNHVDPGDPEDWPWGKIGDGLRPLGERTSLGPWTIDEATGTIAASGPPDANTLRGLAALGAQAAHAMRRPFEQEVIPGAVPGAALVLAASKNANPYGSLTVLADETAVEAMPPAGPVAENEICDPDNIGTADQATADAGQLTCALSPDTITVMRPGRWVNARKGDVILSPSDQWSLVADVLASVKPSQPFSHSGIMTRNYDEVTHSTASEEWLMDHLSDGLLGSGTDGFDPEALRYLWPGVVAQSVQASIEGEPWVAPDNGKSYEVSSFSPASGTSSGFGFVPAMVVKPDPLLEVGDPAIRAKLHDVADGVRGYAGRPARDGQPAVNSQSHYRFYCFTDARLSETEVAPAGLSWASGTFPSVCSVLIWREMRKHGVQLEGPAATVTQGDLELSDTLAGAMVAPGTLDGLYHYTADERQDAGHILFDKIHAAAYEQAGWLGEALTDASDDTANQVCNAFANDDVHGTDSDAWESTGDSDGVAPVNIMFWDGPDRGGLYGFAEPAVYRPPRREKYRLSRWRKYAANGVVSGTVRRPNGTAVAGATVQIVDSRVGASDAAGHYSIANIPYVLPEGSEYSLTAVVIVDGELHQATQTVLVNQAAVTADIVLEAPPSLHRKLTVVASVVGGDDEDWPEDDESYSHTNAPATVELSKEAPFKVFGTGRDPIFRWGGEVRVEHYLEFAVLPDASIVVSLKGWLYEGTSESTDDLDGSGGLVRKIIGPGQTDAVKLRMSNTAEDEPDTFSELTVTVTNDSFP